MEGKISKYGFATQYKENPEEYTREQETAEIMIKILHWLLHEICTSRLFCLNKEAFDNGKLDKIRPIAVPSFFMKIIEASLLNSINFHIEENKLLHCSQIGFIKETGCELNLMRLRLKLRD